MNHDAFIGYLRNRLTKPLPGWDYQQRMSPIIAGNRTNKPRNIPQDAHQTGVAALLFPGEFGSLAFQHEIIHLPKMRAQDFEVLAPCWPIHPKNHLWGATAMCVSELIGLYTDFMHENE